MLEKLKLDTWYGILLYLGVLLVSASLLTTASFIQKKHLFGFGLGFALIGLAFIIAEKYWNQFLGHGILYTKIIKHNIVSYIMLVIGAIMTILFGFLIVRELI